jgi:hypothetical protein
VPVIPDEQYHNAMRRVAGSGRLKPARRALPGGLMAGNCDAGGYRNEADEDS